MNAAAFSMVARASRASASSAAESNGVTATADARHAPRTRDGIFMVKRGESIRREFRASRVGLGVVPLFFSGAHDGLHRRGSEPLLQLREVEAAGQHRCAAGL